MTSFTHLVQDVPQFALVSLCVFAGWFASSLALKWVDTVVSNCKLAEKISIAEPFNADTESSDDCSEPSVDSQLAKTPPDRALFEHYGVFDAPAGSWINKS